MSAEDLERGLAGAIDGESGTDGDFDEQVGRAQAACFVDTNESGR